MSEAPNNSAKNTSPLLKTGDVGIQKRWKILMADEHKVDALYQCLKINRTLCKILVSRGIDTFDKAKLYLKTKINNRWNDCYLFYIDIFLGKCK